MIRDVRGLFRDGWCALDLWFEVDGECICEFCFFLPALAGESESKTAVIVHGTDVFCERIPRGKIHTVGPFRFAGRSRIAFAFAETEPEAGTDLRPLGAKLIHVIVNGHSCAAEALASHAGSAANLGRVVPADGPVALAEEETTHAPTVTRVE